MSKKQPKVSKPSLPGTYKEFAKALGLDKDEAMILMHIAQAATIARDSASMDDGRRERIYDSLESVNIEIYAGPVLRIVKAVKSAPPRPPVQPTPTGDA